VWLVPRMYQAAAFRLPPHPPELGASHPDEHIFESSQPSEGGGV
jgi:hypothetical protein